MPQKTRTCARCPSAIYIDNKTGLCRPCLNASYIRSRNDDRPADQQVLADRHMSFLRVELAGFRRKYDESLKIIERQEKELGALAEMKAGLETFAIKPRSGSGTNEGTVVIAASDWHVEENVGKEVGGLNTYNLDIAKQRAVEFFQGGLRLTNLLGQDIKINTVVLGLLGDFITNDIHDELQDLTEVTPVHAIVHAQNYLISGIEYWLGQSNYDLVIVCHSGNHARTTRQTHFSAENGHSLEYLMYLHLAAYFRNNARVKFVIPEGYHSYVQVYDMTLRFHHGHAVKYQGGVGGIYIPINKAIAQWDKARHADLDVFGHFHQFRDGGNFICNGSMIGYNGFALSIKADFEKPKQGLFLIDKKRGRTATWPIYFSV